VASRSLDVDLDDGSGIRVCLRTLAQAITLAGANNDTSSVAHRTPMRTLWVRIRNVAHCVYILRVFAEEDTEPIRPVTSQPQCTRPFQDKKAAENFVKLTKLFLILVQYRRLDEVRVHQVSCLALILA
jgi:hypothetical protein